MQKDNNTQSLTRQTLKIFWQHAARYTWMPYGLVLGMTAFNLLRLVPILYYRRLIDLLAGAQSGADVWPQAVRFLVIILVIAVVRIIIRRSYDFLQNYFQPRVMADLMRTCYEYLQNHSIGFFNSSFVGSLVTKVKRYERAFEQLSEQLLNNVGRSLVELVFVTVVLTWRSHLLGAIMAGWTVVYIAVVYVIVRYKLPYDLKRAQTDTEVTAQLADTITNNFNIKIFSNYLLEFRRFIRVVENQFKARKKSENLGTLGETFQGLYMVILEFAMLYFAVGLWRKGLLTVGDIVLVQGYLVRIFDLLWDTGKTMRIIYESLADANEMTEILLQPHEVQDEKNAAVLRVPKGEINFQNVFFGYHPETEILNNFSLKIKPGEKVALIGPSGGGKSTIVKLLLRFYDIQSGEILIDGQNIAAVAQDSLRGTMALVPQEPILFHRSLLDNIRYANPRATDEEVIAAAKLAHAHEFITKSADGYNTFVGERGIKLSGGERQRVAIARAILKNAPILIFDEATSSLDSESEYLIQDALKKLMADKTTIVIAHRLSTIMQMDRIVVIDGGRILEQGKHEELLKAQSGTYQRLWNIQAGGFANA